MYIKRVDSANDIWSLYSNTSLVNMINNSNSYNEVDKDTLDINNKSIIYSNKTNEYFNMTTSKFNLLWKDTIKIKILY